MKKTREERARRRRMCIHLLCLILWAVLVFFVLFAGGVEEPPVEETPTEEPVVAVQTVAEPIAEYNPAYEKEAVSNEYDPVRADIPMDAELQRLLYDACGETGIRYELALAVIWQETDFGNIVGDGGDSIGYMQVQEKYHADRMARLNVESLSDPYGNFLVGCDYLAELVEKDRGLEWALMAYNGGPTYANKMSDAGKVSQYATEVVSYFEYLGCSE